MGGGLRNNLNLLQNTQNRILKIINKNIFYKENPLNLKQIFAYECVLYYYIELSYVYAVTTSKTRNKFIRPPKCTKAVSDKSNYIMAIKVFNDLPDKDPDLKCLDITKKK